MSLTVHRFDDIHAFADRVVPYLIDRESEHILPLGLINTWRAAGLPSEMPYLGCAQRHESVVAVMTCNPNFRAVVAQSDDGDAVRALADDLCAADGFDTILGAMGGQQVAKTFADQWAQRTGCTVRLNRAERIYRLNAITPTPYVPGVYRPPTDADYELLVDWLIAFELEADAHSPHTTPRENYQRGVRIRAESDPMVRGFRVWEHDGQVVSMAGYAGPTGNGIRIGPVYTPPEQRGHGYATALTEALTRELLGMGFTFVSLFTDLSNPTSNAIYQKIGYRPVIDVDEYAFTYPGGG
jgi:hypothetical protein